MLLITGGSGFIGRKVVKRLLDVGYRLACVCLETEDELISIFGNEIYRKIHWIHNHIQDIECLFSQTHIEGIIHIATVYGRDGGKDIFKVFEANVWLPLQLLRLGCENGSHFFLNTDSFFSREMENGWQKNKIVYMNEYTKSKFIFREITKESISSLSIAFINLELQHVYGTGDRKDKFVSFLRDQLKSNVNSISLSDGTQTRDWIFADDVVEAYLVIIRNMDKFSSGKFYHYEVGTGVETSLKTFAEMMKSISGSEAKLEFGKIHRNNNELEHSVANNCLLKDLGWEPQYSLEKGIRRLLEE